MRLLRSRRLLRAARPCVLAMLAVLALAPAFCQAATVPPGFTDSVHASGLSSPTAMAIAPDGRIFVAQQGGALRVIKNGTLLATPFLTVPVNASGERGLLGVAFDPNFGENRYVYVYYTTSSSPIHNRVSRFTASGSNPDVAAPGETILLDLENLSATNHNGGAMHFGVDGKLYIAAGENAVGSNSQSLGNLLGKILRMNRDGTIPTDNPFYATASGKNRLIWARGLRNPFTFAVERGSGRILINDVGQNTWEEIDLGVAGANYGWPSSEGPTNCGAAGFTCPIYSYNHSQGCAITGGAFYDPPGPSFPASYDGKYFFAEYCGGWIKVIDPDAPPANNAAAAFATGIASPVDLQVGPDGSLYYLARGAGTVGRIQYTAAQPPAISQQPADQTVPVGGTASFSVSATGTPPFLYQWQVNQADIPGANGPTLQVPDVQAGDDGARFRAQVLNDFDAVFSNEAVLTVLQDTPPTGTITTPVAGTHYAGGQLVEYAGTASDAQDASIPPAAFTWRVDFHHASHVHPFVAETSGATSGSFVVPTTGETATDVWYRIVLTVRDSAGLTHTSVRDVLPDTSTITLASNPAGLQLTLDGQPVTAPVAVASVVGVQRSIGAVSPQSTPTGPLQFASWSDGGAATHTIATPAGDATYTANFVPSTASGNGLSGAYYTNRNLSGAALTRVDPTVDFAWGTAAPIPERLPANNFSVRWTGQVEPQFSGPTTFHALADDGVRLWIGNVLVVDRWNSNAGESSGVVNLVAGQKVPVRMEVFEKNGSAAARLSWSHASLPKQVIPQARLSTP